eukprot:TRINITY_DN3122_c0_g1_i1.p1 TRINITY_DN3122_c0_g1~~TRINITY_DN3122_c0_g1_i1.p1  ORF type:complete len:507 (+),score=172.00 TRINITY_DN3122_c0_g1_i1:111-1631(+)
MAAPATPVSPEPRAFATLSAAEQEDVRDVFKTLHILRLSEDKTGAKRGFLTRDKFETILKQAVVLDLPEGYAVQKEGTDVHQLTCVIEGRLAKFQKGKQDSPDIVEYLHPGDQIGQLHMVAGSDTASSSVIVDSETARVAILKQADLDSLLSTDPQLLRLICNNLALALRDHVRRHHSNRLVRLVESMQKGRSVAAGQVHQKVSGGVHFLAGALSGIGSMSLAYPLDVSRTLLQKQGRGDIMYGFEVLAKLLKEDGIGAWYRGWSSHTTSHTVQNAVYHSAHAKMTDIMKERHPIISDPVRLLLGILAGCVAATVVTPLTIVTFRLQGAKDKSMGALGMISKIIAEEGFFSLWNGIGPSLVLSINPCITFYVFDELKSQALRRKARAAKAKGEDELSQTKLSPLETLIVGATAKAIASIITFPLLMAKIRMGLYGKERYPTMLGTFAIVLREEGTAGLFKGMGMSLLRSILVAAIEFVMRERCIELVIRIAEQLRGKTRGAHAAHK